MASCIGPENDSSRYSHLFSFSGLNKAGMDGCDKDTQERIIYEMSKNSSYFKQAERQDKQTDAKISAIKTLFDAITDKQESHLKLAAVNKSVDIEKHRSFDRICCVLDMDMFYAAVEIRDNPHLKDLPVAVGGASMICTANYVARKFGVRSAMPGFIATKLCPNLVFVNCNFEKYERVASQIRSIIGDYDPHFHSHSLDEVYFDLTNAAINKHNQLNNNSVSIEFIHENAKSNEESNKTCTVEQPQKRRRSNSTDKHLPMTFNHHNISIGTLREHAWEILMEIRLRITEVTGGLTCSAGIANNFFLAKICADRKKPDGQFAIAPDRDAVMAFIENLPTRKVGGIGKVTEKILSKLGMNTLGDVRKEIYRILHAFTPKAGEFLARVSLGVGEEEGKQSNAFNSSDDNATNGVGRKSMGCERTFPNMRAPAAQFSKLKELSEMLSADLVEKGLWGRTVTLKLKTSKFALHTRSSSQIGGGYFQSANIIHALALPLLERMMPIELRLMGLSVSNFKDSVHSPSFGCSKISDYFSSNSNTSSSSAKASLPHLQVNDESCSINCQTKEEDNQRVTSDFDLLAAETISNDETRSKECTNESLFESTNSVPLSSSRTEGDWECPVCTSARFSTLRSLNHHMDLCLNTQFLQSEE